MADDKTLKIVLEAQDSASAPIKQVTDETQRYQEALKQMAEKDATGDQEKRWADLNARAKEYAATTKANIEAQQKWDEALKQFKKAQEEGGEATEQAEHEGRAQYMLFGEMNKIMPELGHGIHAAFAGWVGMAIEAVIAIHECYSALQDFNTAADKAAEGAQSADFASNIVGQMKAIGDAAVQARGFVDSLNQIAGANDNLNTKLQSQLTLLQAIERAQAANTSAQKALDIAKIQEAEAEHRITPEQAAEQRAAIEKKYIQQTQTDQENAQDAELKDKQDTLKKAQDAQKGFNDKYNDDLKKVAAEQSHDANVALDPIAQVDKIRKVTNLLTRFDELEQKVVAGKAGVGEFGEYLAGRDSGLKERAQAEVKRLQQELAAYQDTQTPEALGQKKADADALAAAQQKAQANETLITELTKQVADLQKTIAATRPVEEDTAGKKTGAVDSQENARIAKDIQKDFAEFDRFAKEKNPGYEMIQEFVNVVKDFMEVTRNNHALTRQLAQSLPEYAQETALMKRETAALVQANILTKAQLESLAGFNQQ